MPDEGPRSRVRVEIPLEKTPKYVVLLWPALEILIQSV
jgi:hypothetical protein